MSTFREVLAAHGWKPTSASKSMTVYENPNEDGKCFVISLEHLPCPRWRQFAGGELWKQGSTVDDLQRYLTRTTNTTKRGE